MDSFVLQTPKDRSMRKRYEEMNVMNDDTIRDDQKIDILEKNVMEQEKLVQDEEREKKISKISTVASAVGTTLSSTIFVLGSVWEWFRVFVDLLCMLFVSFQSVKETELEARRENRKLMESMVHALQNFVDTFSSNIVVNSVITLDDARELLKDHNLIDPTTFSYLKVLDEDITQTVFSMCRDPNGFMVDVFRAQQQMVDRMTAVKVASKHRLLGLMTENTRQFFESGLGAFNYMTMKMDGWQLAMFAVTILTLGCTIYAYKRYKNANPIPDEDLEDMKVNLESAKESFTAVKERMMSRLAEMRMDRNDQVVRTLFQPQPTPNRPTLQISQPVQPVQSNPQPAPTDSQQRGLARPTGVIPERKPSPARRGRRRAVEIDLE